MTAMFTAFYSFRLISLTFLGYPNAPQKSYNNVHEADIYVIIPLVFLSLFSIFFGYFASDLYIGLGSDLMGSSLFQHPNNITMVEAEFSLPILIKLLPAILSILGALSAILLYHNYSLFLFELTENKFGRKLYTFLNGKYLLDIVYNKYIIRAGLNTGYIISKILDRGVLEYCGPFGITLLLNSISFKLNKLDNGLITSYVVNIILSLFFIISFLYLFSPLAIYVF
jgi:NADH-ubiquinone oxidoreductase chain 5